MEIESFEVKNVKCAGCAANIETGLGSLPGVKHVSVAIEGGRVTVDGEGLSRERLAAKLAELGYPEI